MITLKKLRSLKSRTCVRKCASLFHQLSQEMDTSYLYGLLTLSEEQQFSEVLDEEQRKQLRSLIRRVPLVQGRDLAILLEDIHYFLLDVLGSDPSDWDLTDDQGALDASARLILPISWCSTAFVLLIILDQYSVVQTPLECRKSI